MEEDLYLERYPADINSVPDKIQQHKHNKKHRLCSRRCFSRIVAIISLTAIAMSILTAVLYFNDKSKKFKENTKSSSFGAVLEHFSQRRSLAYAHKTLIADFQTLSSKREERSWLKTFRLNIDPQNNHRRFETSRGVALLPDGIRIELSGVYFVYKSILFAPASHEKCENFPVQSFVSRLVVVKKGQDSPLPTSVLLRSVHTCCPTCIESTETTYTGGVFHLDRDDVIQVDVTADELIDVARDLTYMGLLMLKPQIVDHQFENNTHS